MRFFIRFFILFASAVGIAVLARYNDSNVVVFFPPYRIDFSLSFLLLAFFLSIFVIYLIIRLTGLARRLPARIKEYQQQKAEDAGNQALMDAMTFFVNGDFAKAKVLAEEAKSLQGNKEIASLIADKSTGFLSGQQKGAAFLNQPEKADADKETVLINQIRLLLEEDKTDQALLLLKELEDTGAASLSVQSLALKVHRQAKNAEMVLKLLPELEKEKAIKPAFANSLRKESYEQLFLSAASSEERLNTFWDQLPETEQVCPVCAINAAKAFFSCQLENKARTLLEKAIAHSFDSGLIRFYRQHLAKVSPDVLLPQIEKLEGWLNANPENREIMLTLGCLCFYAGQSEKAKPYLEKAIDNQTDLTLLCEGHLLLAKLYEAANDSDQALAHYKASANAAQNRS